MYLPNRAKFLAKLIYQKYQNNLIGSEFTMNIPVRGTDRITLFGVNGYIEELQLNHAEYQHKNSYEIESSLQDLEKHGLLQIDRISIVSHHFNISISPALFEAVETNFGATEEANMDRPLTQTPLPRADIQIFNDLIKRVEKLSYNTYQIFENEQLIKDIKDAVLSFAGAESSYYKDISKRKLYYSRALEENKQPYFEQDQEIFLAVLKRILNNLYLTTSSAKDTSLIAHPIFGEPYPQHGNYPQIMVLMPFQEEMKPIYQNHILKVTEKLRLTCARADDWLTNRVIMREVWSGIYYADICIADCTGRNPNVLYELGIAHTLGKECILIAQSAKDTESILPFDIQHFRTIIYEKDNLDAFRKILEGTIRNTLPSLSV